MGNGTKFSEELFEVICERIAQGEAVIGICKDPDMPSQDSFYKWIRNDDALAEKYARAREAQADLIFDDILEIADDGQNDWMERNGEEDKGWQVNGEHIQRSKLRIDARKWMASKLAPKKYGDKIQAEIGGPNGASLVPVVNLTVNKGDG